MNLYAYVANDPINNIDPSGKIIVVLKEILKQVAKKKAKDAAKSGAKGTKNKKSGAENKTGKTREGGPRLKDTSRDGKKTDLTDKRVKQSTPNKHPKAPKDAMQKTKFKNSQPGSKGYKRDPSKLEKEILDEIREYD